MRKTLCLIPLLIAFQTLAQDLHSNPSKINEIPKTLNEKISPEDRTLLVRNKHKKPISIFDHNHEAWSQILKDHVLVVGSTTQFKYKKLKSNSESFNKYLTELSLVSQKEFDHWSPHQQIAFLINAYNAFTVKLIIDNYPVKSIKNIGGLFTKPWKIDFFHLFGKQHHLDWIEHEVLRKNYKEPRIHFAVNCASIGCPALRNEAYTAEKLDQQLDDQAKLFLKDNSRNYIKENTLNLSKIFDWFEEDFSHKHPHVQAFVAPYITENPRLLERLRNNKFNIRYTSYDWSLNEVP